MLGIISGRQRPCQSGWSRSVASSIHLARDAESIDFYTFLEALESQAAPTFEQIEELRKLPCVIAEVFFELAQRVLDSSGAL